MRWQDAARNLPLGQRRKVKHCSTSPTAYISKGINGLSIHCFRCGCTEFEPIAEHSIADLKARNSLDSVTKLRGMPTDAASVCTSPTTCVAWLVQGGLTPEKADEHGMRWHEPSRRLLIPIYDHAGKVSGLLARAVNGERPKYMMLQGSPGVHYPKPSSGKRIVVVEDVLSAIACNRAGYNAAAMLGTSLTPPEARHIGAHDEVVVFMDPDNAGDLGARSIRKRLSLYPCSVRIVRAARDPKYIGSACIREAVEETRI